MNEKEHNHYAVHTRMRGEEKRRQRKTYIFGLIDGTQACTNCSSGMHLELLVGWIDKRYAGWSVLMYIIEMVLIDHSVFRSSGKATFPDWRNSIDSHAST